MHNNPKKIMANFFLSKAEHKHLRTYANKHGISATAVLRTLIQQHARKHAGKTLLASIKINADQKREDRLKLTVD